jgi:uncharacterized membrane protein YqaE (UPF0057 family)
MDIIKIILTILFPPLGVFLHTGFSKQLLLSLILTLLAYFPGLVHGIYVISQPQWRYRE